MISLMPDASFYKNLKTEIENPLRVLIVDEKGGLFSSLIDLLLDRVLETVYFGKEVLQNFSHLYDKKLFRYAESLQKEVADGNYGYIIYFPDEKQENIENVFQMAEKFSAKVLIGVPCQFASLRQLKEKINFHSLVETVLVYFDFLFGPRVKKGILGEIFNCLRTTQSISIEENSQTILSVLPSKKALEEVVRLLLSKGKAQQPYYLCGKKLSFLELTEMIKQIVPEKQFFFSDFKSKTESGLMDKEVEKKKVVFDLQTEIEETLDWFLRNTSSTEVFLPEAQEVQEGQGGQGGQETSKEVEALFEKPFQKEASDIGRRRVSAWQKAAFGFSLFLLSFFIFFVFPILFSGLLTFYSIKQVGNLRVEMERGNFAKAAKQINRSTSSLEIAQKTLNITTPFYGLVGLGDQIEAINKVFVVLNGLGSSAKVALSSAGDLSEGIYAFLEGQDLTWLDKLPKIKAELSSAYEQASLAQAFLPNTRSGFAFFKQEKIYELLESNLPKAREVLLKSKDFVAILPGVIGVGDKKTYLVLIQNNNELRPTGGFIGSYGLIYLENGKLVNFEVFDIYQADGQLKGHVEPPAKLKEYLGEANWYFRDSNWDPDFPTSAKRAQWFLDKEMQVSVDGTIALNLEAIKKILSGIGEIELPDYKEKINEKNLFSKAEYYSELGTFAGSTQKKDFLGSLSRALLEKIKQANTGKLLGVGEGVFSALESKEIMVYFSEPKMQEAITDLGWEGGVKNFQSKGEKQGFFGDYLFLVEANVGINKANYFLKRDIDHKIFLTKEGKVEERLKLTYENQSPSESWPAGKYKTYLRIYLPSGTKLNSALASEANNGSLWMPIDSRFIDQIEDRGKNVLGIMIEVPIKSKKQIEISYELPQTVDVAKKVISYVLMLQKQSGAYPSNYILNFYYPDSLVPVRVIPSAVVGEKQLVVSSKLTKDSIFQFDLAKK